MAVSKNNKKVEETKVVVNITPMDRWKAEKMLDNSLMEMAVQMRRDVKASKAIEQQTQYDTLKQFTNCNELVTQVNIMHFIDILFCNTDRHSSNYAFSVNEDGSAKLVVLDNELMLHDFFHATRPVSFPTQCHLTFTQYTKECEYKYFLETLPEDQKEILYKYICIIL